MFVGVVSCFTVSILGMAKDLSFLCFFSFDIVQNEHEVKFVCGRTKYVR